MSGGHFKSSSPGKLRYFSRLPKLSSIDSNKAVNLIRKTTTESTSDTKNPFIIPRIVEAKEKNKETIADRNIKVRFDTKNRMDIFIHGKNN